MSYSIQYGKKGVEWKPYKKSKGTKALWVIVILTLLITGIRICGTDRIVSFLIPGDIGTTKAAFREFVSSVKDGEQVGDAFYCFCEEIVAGASSEKQD